jgi:transposase
MDRPITREQFEAARTLLERARRRTRPRRHDLYDVFSGVMWLLESGGPWRALPDEYPPWRTVHEYFTQWTLPIQQPTLLEQALTLVGRPDMVERLHAVLQR